MIQQLTSFAFRISGDIGLLEACRLKVSLHLSVKKSLLYSPKEMTFSASCMES